MKATSACKGNILLIDTHCHLDDAAFCGDLAHVIDRGRRAGVTKFIVPGVFPGQWDAVAVLARDTACIRPAFGLHPMHADLYSDEVGAKLERLLGDAVATGEIGLDYTLTAIPREVQMAAFRSQLRLSVDLGLPVSIHCRRAFADLLRIVKEERVSKVGGAMHAFSGSPEIAHECIKLGLLISVAGSVTYPNAKKPVEVVKQVPLSSLLLETDAPDMAPEPYRGTVNEPAFILETLKKIACIKNVSVEDVAVQTTANAERLFRLRERNSHVFT